MDQLMKRYIKPGLILHVVYTEISTGEGPILDRLDEVIGDNYFDAVEISKINDAEVRKVVANRIKAAGLTAYYGAQGRTMNFDLNLCDVDENGRKKAVQSVKAGIDEAIELGCEAVQFMSGSPHNSTVESAYAKLVESTKELCDYARSKGIPLVCEMFDYDVDKRALIGPSELAAKYAKEITRDYPEFGLQVDLSHIPLMHEEIRPSLFAVRDYIKHIHIGNAVVNKGAEAYGDMHPRFGFPNSANGVKEVAEFLGVLFEIGYLGGEERKTISFEVRPWKDEASNTVIANAKRTLDQAWLLVR